MSKSATVNKVKPQNYSYMQLASPGKFIIFMQLFCSVMRRVFQALTAIFTAKITVGVYRGITTGDFSGAYSNLIMEFVCIFTRSLFYWLAYVVLYNKAFNKSFMKVSKVLIDKLLNSKTSNFSTTSNEKIQNIMMGDVDVVSYFSDSFCANLAKLVQGAIAFCVVANASWWVALIMIGFCVVNFLIRRFLNNKIARTKGKQYEAKEGVYESVNRILDSKEVINEFDANGEYESKYLKACQAYTKSDNRRYSWVGARDIWFYVYYMFIIGLLTAVMIFLVSQGKCTVELYLIVVPYFLTITETFNGVFDITQNIADKNVSMSRINTILNFTDEEINKFGNIEIKNGVTNLSFVGVNYKNTDHKSAYFGELKDIDISFAQNSLNIVYGEKWCGKRLIFNMLRRKIQPDSGYVLLDNISINQYNKKSYNSNVYYTTAKPEFIDGTIMENFTAINRHKNKIYKICKKLDIYDDIKRLPKGFDSNIDSKLTRALKFLIGLARSLLTDCNTLLIYELPNSLTQCDKDKISSVLWQLSKRKTIILFSHTDEFSQIAKTTYHIVDGEVKEVNINDNSSFCLLQQFDVSLGNNVIIDNINDEQSQP